MSIKDKVKKQSELFTDIPNWEQKILVKWALLKLAICRLFKLHKKSEDKG